MRGASLPRARTHGARRDHGARACVRAHAHRCSRPSHFVSRPLQPCSLKESELRAALEPSARAAAAAQVGAGARVEQRARRTEGAPGGADNVALGVFGGGGGGTSEYKESMAGAQARLALDPRVREDAAGVTLAGGRVQPRWLGSSIRTTRPSGGASTLPLKWDEPRGAAAGAPPPSSPARSVRPGSLVGGFSGKYLAPAAAPAPAETGRGQNSSGAAGVLSWARVAAAAPGADAAAPPPPPAPAPEAHVDAAALPPAGGRAAAAPSLPLKPLPHAHSFADLLTEAPAAADFDAAAHAAKTLRRMAPAPPPALPPFATAYDGAAAAPPPTQSSGRARPPRVIIDVAARGAPHPRSMPAHLSSTYVFG